MTDYLLKFPSKSVAEQFGLSSGFSQIDENGEVKSNLASHNHAMCVIGEHNQSDWWVLFRDISGIPIPEGASAFIFWSSDFSIEDENGNNIPVPRPISEDVPDTWWA